jgi:hypothetical protein
MSTLQVGNIHLESTGNNRIQYNGSNTVSVVVAGANVIQANSSSMNLNIGPTNIFTSNGTNTSITNLSAAGLTGTIPVSVLGSGANSTNFLRGDQTFAVPSTAPSNFQIFLANGTYTRTSGVTKALVFAQGGGANGGASTGGGAGELRVGIISPGATETVTVIAGTAGSNTLFGSHITARGGAASRATPTGSGGTRVDPFTPVTSSYGSASLFGPGGATGEPAQGYGGGGGGSPAAAGSPGFVLILEYP